MQLRTKYVFLRENQRVKMTQKSFSFFIPDKENPLPTGEEFRRILHSLGFCLFLLVFGSFLIDAFLYFRNGNFLYTFGYAVILILYALGWLLALFFGRTVTCFFICFNFLMFCVFKEYYKVNVTPLLFYDILSAFKEGVRAGLSNKNSLFDIPFFIVLIYSVLTLIWVIKHPFFNFKKAGIGFLIGAVFTGIAYMADIFYWAELCLFLFPSVYISYEQGMLYKITYPAEILFKNPLQSLNQIIIPGNREKLKSYQTDSIFLSRLPQHIYLIQVESLTTQAVQPNVMPFLSSVQKTGSVWSDVNHYHCLGSANTDFGMMSGLPLNQSVCHLMVYFSYPPDIYKQIKPLPKRLAEKGYQSSFYHSFEKSFFNRLKHYSHMGFQKLYFMEDYPADWVRGEWGVSDGKMLQLAALQTPRHQKTFDFIITTNMHPPFFSHPDERYPYPTARTVRENYMNAAFELDLGLKNFYEALPNDSFVILYGDHNAPDADALDTPLILFYKGNEADKPIIHGKKPTGFSGTIDFVNSLFDEGEEE